MHFSIFWQTQFFRMDSTQRFLKTQHIVLRIFYYFSICENLYSLIKHVQSLKLQSLLLLIFTMILTHKIRNIFKTAPCRACSTLPNLYSLIIIIVSPQTACLSHLWTFTPTWTDGLLAAWTDMKMLLFHCHLSRQWWQGLGMKPKQYQSWHESDQTLSLVIVKLSNFNLVQLSEMNQEKNYGSKKIKKLF